MSKQDDIYQEIRPYTDAEIAPAVERLINDAEFIDAIIQYKFSHLGKWLKLLITPIVKYTLRRKWSKLTSVYDVQLVVEQYLTQCLKETSKGVKYIGLEKLDPNTPYLFISNHRDIAMDPALVNYGLHHSQHKTVRIAIGDNLLKKDCATELMKLNKSFIVKRSVKAPREMIKALGLLSSYIKHSLETENSIWIAQREGRAKDGHDITEPALLKMLQLEGRKRKQNFADYIKSLKIVPVAISYENDPCDVAKANELYQKAVNGHYEKSELEDIDSIVQGIVGEKGHIHVSFGDVIEHSVESVEELAKELDKQIHNLYHLYPINLLAAGVEDDSITDEVREQLQTKLNRLPKEAHPYLLDAYANPVRNNTNLEK